MQNLSDKKKITLHYKLQIISIKSINKTEFETELETRNCTRNSKLWLRKQRCQDSTNLLSVQCISLHTYHHQSWSLHLA